MLYSNLIEVKIEIKENIVNMNNFERRRRCTFCKKLTHKWQSVNGSPIHCYDGCHSTTGCDRRTITGKLLSEGGKPWPKWLSG